MTVTVYTDYKANVNSYNRSSIKSIHGMNSMESNQPIPEQQARAGIDQKLLQAYWVIQDKNSPISIINRMSHHG